MYSKKKENHLLFYDYESFNISPRAGALSQFAAIKTDEDLNEISVYNVFCAPPTDMVPEVDACLVTGITPQHAQAEGFSEYDFAGIIQKAMTSSPNTCIIGYNNINFDDEYTRQLFYRNLKDPYGWHFRNGNTRFDLSNMTRLVYALRPDIMNWPEVDVLDEGGAVIGRRISFKLEHLSAANGIVHENAHDALSDVRALIGLWRIIKAKAPDLFDTLFNLRFKYNAENIINGDLAGLFGYVNYKFKDTNYVSLMKKLGDSYKDKSKVWAWDLRIDPTPFIGMSNSELDEVIKLPFSQLKEQGIQGNGMNAIKTNAVPFVFEKSWLSGDVAERSGLSSPEMKAQVKKSLAILKENPDFIQRLCSVYENREFGAEPTDTDMTLYSGGFIQKEELDLGIKFGKLDGWVSRYKMVKSLPADSRAYKILFRVVGRNDASVFDEHDTKVWNEYVSDRFQGKTENSLLSLADLEARLAEIEFNDDSLHIKDALTSFIEQSKEKIIK